MNPDPGIPRLAFCIPTYKRPDQLERCVRSLIRAGGAHGVAIVIADDSTDDTNAAVVARLQADYPAVQWHRNPVNLGIDRNILHAVDLCPARYAWIMGEDDRVRPEAVATVLAALDRGDRPFVFVNYASVDHSGAIVLKPRALPLDADGDLGAAAFVADEAWAAGFIGACVINMADWRRHRTEAFTGTWFAHVGNILTLAAGGTVRRIAAPLVLNRCGSPETFTWTDQAFDVLDGWGRMIDGLGTRYDADTKCRATESFERAHGLNSVYFLAYLRAGGAYDLSVYRTRYRTRGSASFRLGARAVAALPPAVFRLARRALNAWRGLRHGRPDETTP